jgi:uncharacterized membrane protein
MTTVSRQARIDSIDVVRGVVMVLMLLDHMRDFVHRGAQLYDPLDLERTTPALFVTRWVTHFCAPVFVFLVGISARMQVERGLPLSELRGYLARRGLFLVAAELVLLRPLIWFNLDLSMAVFLQVIWVIGCGMLVLATLLRGPAWLPGVFGASVVLLHNLLDGVEPGPSWRAPWTLLHGLGPIALVGESGLWVQYALIPWIAVPALGYAFGGLFAAETARRRRVLVASGLACLASFALLRATSSYGDPEPWRRQESALFDAFAFIDVEKYPPSLCYLLATLGPTFFALAALDGRDGHGWAKPFVVFGRVPFFFYVLQWPLVHAIAMLFQLVDGQPVGWQTVLPWTRAYPLPEHWGFSLATTYLAWLLGLLVALPLCAWFGRFKARHPRWRWLSYL